ncbi:hypothetical protein FBU31_000608 [Coemansia sp. 'formosensis']|nr:hypothetical protein FBU31_000608 [Coemansia sp. 'formosensis']
MSIEVTNHGATANEKSELVCGGIASIDVGMVERHIAREVETYSAGGFPRQSERYYYLMSALHVTRMMFHDGNCQPFHREFYKRLAQIHHSQQGSKLESMSPPSTDTVQQGIDQPHAH